MINLTPHCRVKDGNGRDSCAPALAGTRTRSESDAGDRHSIFGVLHTRRGRNPWTAWPGAPKAPGDARKNISIFLDIENFLNPLDDFLRIGQILIDQRGRVR